MKETKFVNEKANERFERKRWKKLIKVGKFRVYLTWNWRMRPRQKRDELNKEIGTYKHRHSVYKRAGGKCEICGESVSYKSFELHHVLPLGRFRHLAEDERNMQCVCKYCHKELHCDVFKEIRSIENKAKELNIELSQYYEIM